MERKVKIGRRFLSLSHRRELARALKYRSPLAHLIVHNLYFLSRFLLLLTELLRLENILRSANIRYYLNGSVLSLALGDRLLPHDLDLIIESNKSPEDLRSLLLSHQYRIKKTQGDILFLERHGIIIDLFIFHVTTGAVTYFDGRKKIRRPTRCQPVWDEVLIGHLKP